MNDAVTALRKLAAKTVSEGMATWAGEPEMLAMVWGDAANMRKVASLIESGDTEAAQEKLDDMDTSPREYAYEALEAVGALVY